jgi:hypothetical protein
VQKRIINTLKHIDIGNNFLNRTSMAQLVRERIDKWDYIKLKTSVQQRKQSPAWRGSHRMGENLPAIHLTRINNWNLQEAKKTKLQRINDSMKKWAMN